MDKTKIVLGYLLGVVISALIVLFVGLSITKMTLLNKSYILKTLDNNNYYNTLYSDILEEMKSYMMSSGLSDEILNDLFTKEEIKEDVITYVSFLYGSDNNISSERIKERLINNINDYLKKSNIKISDQDTLNLFVEDICNIYENEICIYKYLNSYVSLLNRITSVINIVLVLTIVLLIICIVIFKKVLLANYLGSCLMSSGLIFLFIKLFIYNRIDVEYLLIITDNFSKVLRSVLNDFGYKLLTASYGLILFGIIIIIKNRLTYKDFPHKKVLKKK